MTAPEYLKHSIGYLENEEKEVEKQRVKFELSNPNGLAKWQNEIIERDKTRCTVLKNLISIIQQYEMSDTRDQKIAEVVERVESKLVIRSDANHAHYCIEKVAKAIGNACKEIDKEQHRGKLPTIGLLLAIGFLEDADAEICKYLNKYFKANNIDYVIE